MMYEFIDNRSALLSVTKPFLKKHKISRSTFGRAAINDPSLLFRVENKDVQPHPKTCKRVFEFIERLRLLKDSDEINRTVSELSTENLNKASSKKKQ